jgi:hypothetical protein
MLDKTEVVNKYTSEYDIDITRTSNSKFQNPYVIGRDGNRREVLLKFELYARKHFNKTDFIELKNKRLGCVCFPQRCHGDILIKLMNEYGILDTLF